MLFCNGQPVTFLFLTGRRDIVHYSQLTANDTNVQAELKTLIATWKQTYTLKQFTVQTICKLAICVLSVLEQKKV